MSNITAPIQGADLAPVPGYEMLEDVLRRAYDQAARGKGKERHANGKAFHDQPMQDLIRLHGVGFATGQASKKASEALGLPTTERQVAELLGAIVYLSGAVIALERPVPSQDPTKKNSETFFPFKEWKGGLAFPSGVFVSTRVEVLLDGNPVSLVGTADSFNWSSEGSDRVTHWRCL